MSILLRLLLAAAFFNGISWIILIPIWQYPDEQAHFAQLQDIAELGKRPIDKLDTSYEIALSEIILGTVRDDLGNNKFTYHPEYKLDYSNSYYGPQEYEILNLPKSARTQLVKNEATLNPPLYYFLGSLFYKLFGDSSLFSRVYAVRLMSLIFFLATVIVSFEIGKLIFKKSKILPIILASMTGFTPMFIFASTGVLPDPLTNLLFALVILLSLKILTSELSYAVMFALTIVIILGSLTRQQFLISIPIIVLPIIYQILKNLKSLKKDLILAASFTVIIFIASFFVKYLQPLRYLSFFEIGRINPTKLVDIQFLQFSLWTIRHTYSEVLPWYWGVYKWLSLTVPHINYQIINRIILVAFIGVIIKLFQVIKNRTIKREDLVLFFMLYSSAVYYLVFLLWDYSFYLGHRYSFGIQGRYFFPMIIPHFTILVIGLWQVSQMLFAKFAKYLLVFTVFLMILFSDITLSYVSASYYETSSISTFVKQASQYKPSLFKGNIIILIILITLSVQVLFLFNFYRYVKKTTD